MRGQIRLGRDPASESIVGVSVLEGLSPPFQVLWPETGRVNGVQRPLYIYRSSVFDVIIIFLVVLLLYVCTQKKTWVFIV